MQLLRLYLGQCITLPLMLIGIYDGLMRPVEYVVSPVVGGEVKISPCESKTGYIGKGNIVIWLYRGAPQPLVHLPGSGYTELRWSLAG